MSEQAVGTEVLVDGTKGGVGFRRPACAGHTARRVDDDSRRLDGTSSQKRRQCQGGGGWVTAGHGDVLLRGQFIAEEFGKSIGEAFDQLGHHMGDLVPLLVDRRVLEPEVSRQVDDVIDLVDKLRDDLLACSVRQASEDDVHVGQGRIFVGHVGHVAIRCGESRVQPGHRLAGLGRTGHGDDVHVRMRGEKPQQLGTGKPGSADDANIQLFSHRMNIQINECSCNRFLESAPGRLDTRVRGIPTYADVSGSNS